MVYLVGVVLGLVFCLPTFIFVLLIPEMGRRRERKQWATNIAAGRRYDDPRGLR